MRSMNHRWSRSTVHPRVYSYAAGYEGVLSGYQQPSGDFTRLHGDHSKSASMASWVDDGRLFIRRKRSLVILIVNGVVK